MPGAPSGTPLFSKCLLPLSATAEPTPTLSFCLAGETGANLPVITERPLLWRLETGWPLGPGQRWGHAQQHWSRKVWGRALWAVAGALAGLQKFSSWVSLIVTAWHPAPDGAGLDQLQEFLGVL